MIETLREGEDPGERRSDKIYKLDLYSIPVFLLEVVVLTGLAYSAYYLHFQHHHKPLVTGFYCDDIAYRQQFVESDFTKKFIIKQDELVTTALLLTIPIVMIIFCELVNSMFGALNFRQIRALCTCCKLHSITRRTLRFSAAYLLGFLIVIISSDILAVSTGRLRPYFAQECPAAYESCLISQQLNSQARDNAPTITTLMPINPSISSNSDLNSSIMPSSKPISAAPTQFPSAQPLITNNNNTTPEGGKIRTIRAVQAAIVERQWIDLTNKNLAEVCRYSPLVVNQENEGDFGTKFDQIATSWPSYPAAILTYAVLFTSCYLSFVGTARPFRLITCVLVMVLLLLAVAFNVQLVKEHYHHWEDVVASAILALVVVTFILYVYLNKFRDSHYYENQKLSSSRKIRIHEHFKGYNNDGAINELNHLDKTDGIVVDGVHNGGENGGSMSNNDLAMRYFQIPRANYRGGSRPISSLNQML